MNIDNYNNNPAMVTQQHTAVTKQLSGLVILLKFALILAMLTVVLSSYIRLVDSAVGCEPWPSCYGHYQSNESTQGINVLTDKGDSSPLRLERISHRILASSLGLVILLIFILSWLPGFRQHTGKLIPSVLLLLTLLLAAIGPIHPEQPLPILTLGNFIGGLSIVVLLFHLYQRLISKEVILLPALLSKGIRAGMFIIILQIIWGGWTSANFAGASCTKTFKCHSIGQENSKLSAVFNPLSSLSLQQETKVVAEAKMSTIQLIHHILAVISLICFIFITGFMMRINQNSNKRLCTDCMLILSLIVGQVLLGMSSLLFNLPIAIVLAHNLLSAVLLMVITSLNLKLSTRTSL